MTLVFNSAHDLKERGFQLRSPPMAILAFDPAGDGKDHDALVAIAREEHQRGEPHDPDFAVEMVFRIMLAHRMPQGWEFPDKLAALLNLDKAMKKRNRDRLQTGHVFAIEVNGVGYGYASSMARKTATPIVPYATVGKSSSTLPPVDAKVTMPRLKALDNTRILAETGYLKTVPGAPGIDMLNKEMQAFVWRGKGRPEAMAGQTDDLVMATTGGLWIGSKVLPPVLKQVRMASGGPTRPASTRVRVN